jgi:predicted NBD/HSP70 family sugar kinase
MSGDLTVPVTAPPAAGPGCGPLAVARERPLRRQVFDRVRSAGAIARIDVAKDLGVSPASVSAIAAELIEAGLIREVDAPLREGDAARGRPPVALGVRPEARFVAGLKLSDHVHTAVVMDFAGGDVASAQLRRGALRLGPEALMAEAEAALDAALARAGLPRAALAAVGAGLPGVVGRGAGRVLWSPILSARDVALGPALSARIGAPVLVDNDANLLTLAELWFGAGRGLSDFAVVTIERGVGMGLVLDGRVYRGATGLGMEFGHTKVQLDGALCRCGQRGCLEAYVADYALVREASTALDWENRRDEAGASLLDHLYAEARAGDAAARTIFSRAGRYLAIGLANIANLFDPPLIVLAGERMRHGFLYGADVIADMENLILNIGRAPPRIEIHAWGDLLWARGAGALALEAATDAAFAPEEAA